MDSATTIRKRQGARLRAARKAAGWRFARSAAKDNGWSESTVRAHEAGTRTIGQDDAERYARRYRAAGAQVTARSILFEDPTAQPRPSERPRDEAPLLSWVAAGKMTDVGDTPTPGDVESIPAWDLPRGDWFALRVSGDSMDEVAPDGSIIVVNRADRRLQRHKFYVFGIRGEATFKRYVDRPVKRLEPFSSNRSHEPIYPGDDFTVIGRVHRVIVDL